MDGDVNEEDLEVLVGIRSHKTRKAGPQRFKELDRFRLRALLHLRDFRLGPGDVIIGGVPRQ